MRIIRGFWHICMINNWQEIIAEQLELMADSGLYDESPMITIGALGPHAELKKLKKLIWPYVGISVGYHSENIEEFEFPTLGLMHKWCCNNPAEDVSVFYIHTKGVFDQRGKLWRDYMNYWNISQWRDCVAKLDEGFDIVGVKFMQPNKWFPQHFSGNFFHARAAHIAKLPGMEELKKEPIAKIGLRWNAEFWNGMGNPKWASMCQAMIDHTRVAEYKKDKLTIIK